VSEQGFQINLADPDEIRAKMPDIRRLYNEKRQALKALTEQVELLGRLVGDRPASRQSTASQSSSTASSGSKAGQNAPAQDRAVQALEYAGRPMGPASLYRYMVENGMEVPKNANVLGSNLWSAWKAGRIMRAPNGVYTPLDGSGRSEWDRPLTDYDYAAAIGMPTPQGPSGPALNGSPTTAEQTSLQTPYAPESGGTVG
jgi:hypothetical protein